MWAATRLESSNWVGVELTYLSPDGQMGFPGNLAVTVRYTLSNNNELRIDYSAVTDKDQGGYDHNWVFNTPGDLNALAARVTDPESGRTVEMYTTEPGVQFLYWQLPGWVTERDRRVNLRALGCVYSRGTALPGLAQSRQLPQHRTQTRREILADYSLQILALSLLATV